MDRNYFTENQIEELKKNSYVKKVTEKTVSFTNEFKKSKKTNEKIWIILSYKET